jgi:hypothetical protein
VLAVANRRARLGVLGALAVVATAALVAASEAAPVAATPATARLTASRFGKGAAENRPAKIVVANANGSGSRVLGTGWFSFVSPDGSQVAVMNGDVNYTNLRLELYASTGGAPTHALRINCGGIVWSPDSTKLACVDYNAAGGGPSQLRLIDAATAAAATLATGFIGGQVSFSPDSTRLVYVQYGTASSYGSSGKLRLINLATRAVTTVRGSGAAAPVWGPTAIAFSTVQPRGRNYTYNVAVIQPNGSAFRQLTRFRPDKEQSGLEPVAWSANGKRLLGGVIGDDWTAFLAYAIDPIHGGARMITRGMTPSALSRDGRFVIGQTGSAATTGLAGSNVVRVPWGGGKPRVLLRQAVYASFNG